MLRRLAAGGRVARQPLVGRLQWRACQPLVRSLPTLGPDATSSHVLNSTFPVLFYITTRDEFSEFNIVQELGVIAASDGETGFPGQGWRPPASVISPLPSVAARTKNIIKDLLAAFTHVFGGETTYYSHLLSETTEAATDKLVSHARKLGATGVVNLRYETTTTMNRLVFGMHATVLAYGTAVVLAPKSSQR